MYHLLVGLLFLVVIILLVGAYVILAMYLFSFVISLIQYLFLLIKTRDVAQVALSVGETRRSWKVKVFTRRFAYSFLGLIIAFHMAVYISQRTKWMGPDNAHLTAKEYYVTGQVLNAFRGIMTTSIHPEFPLMIPLNAWQQAIYEKGSKYLPTDDGEIAVWQNQWFHYHYTKKQRRALFTVNWEPSPETVKLLDLWWFCLEAMATRTFSDSKMEEERYYQDYISLAMAYSLNKGFYSGKILGSGNRMPKMSKHVDRSRGLSQWLWDLREKWRASESMKHFLKKHPKLLAMWQFETLFEFQDVIKGEIHERKFSCDNLSTQRLIIVRKEFTDPEKGVPAYRLMKGRNQAERLYNMTINAPSPRAIRYILKHYCGILLAGSVDFSYWESWANRRGTTAEE